MVYNREIRMMGVTGLLLGGVLIYGGSNDSLNFVNGMGAGLAALGGSTFLLPEISRLGDYGSKRLQHYIDRWAIRKDYPR